VDFVTKHFDFTNTGRCVVIGEIGVNHNNDRGTLFRLIDEGIAAGLDIIKLQRFKAADEIAESAPSTEYQVNAGVGSSQLAMAQALELSDNLLVEAFEYCRAKKVGFLCTAFDHGSVDFLANVLKVKTVKVPSPEMTNRPLIEHMAQRFEGLLISTGASDLGEVARVLQWVEGVGKREVALMHCTSEYPAPLHEANLRAISTMRTAFGLPVGYSDHTQGVVAGTVAATLGAAMIEKHYTLDKKMKGPDHLASADLPELKALVQAMAAVAGSLGDGIKVPVPAERKNLPLIRKSLTCAAPRLEKGTVAERSMFGIKRPQVAGAVEPFDLDKIIGLTLQRAKRFDEPILWSDFQ